MHSNLSSSKTVPMVSSITEPESSPVLTELSKKMHFFRFLQREISTAKTEAEKEAVLAILMKVKIQIRTLQREVKRIQKIQQPIRHNDSHHASKLCVTLRIQ